MLRGDTTPKFSEDVGITLRVGGDGGTHDAIVLQSDGSSSNGSQNGCGYNEDGSAYTLNGRDKQSIAFAQNQRGEVRLEGLDGSHVGALSSNPAQTKGQGQSLILTQFGEVAGTLLARADSSLNADGGQNVVCMHDGQSKGTVCDDGASTTLNASHEQPIVCAADDNGKTAIEEDLCGSLKVGGGVALNSNGEGIVGALCARDYKGVGNEYVNEGKVICQKHTC